MSNDGQLNPDGLAALRARFEQQSRKAQAYYTVMHAVRAVLGGDFAEPAFRSIAWRGRYLVVGFANGEIPKLPWNLMLLKGASVVGVFWGDFVRREPQANMAAMRQMMGWMLEGKLRPLVSRRYALEDTAQALNDMAARKVTGKVVIVP